MGQWKEAAVVTVTKERVPVTHLVLRCVPPAQPHMAAPLCPPSPCSESFSSKSCDQQSLQKDGRRHWSETLPFPLPFPLPGMFFFFFPQVAYKVELMVFPDVLQSDKTANTPENSNGF